MSSPKGFASGLKMPYYAVIFSSLRTEGEHDYGAAAQRMEDLAGTMPGYLGIESARDADGFGITISYWRDEASITAWRRHGEHVVAQERGKREWYTHYEIRVARVERSYSGPGVG
jgi:heme-degrading monooxygenase HmoA